MESIIFESIFKTINYSATLKLVKLKANVLFRNLFILYKGA